MDQNSPCSALELVFKRRSCRIFTDTPVTPEELDSILRAGCCAPTSKALYPCHFLVVDSRSEMQKICEYHNMSKALVTAPLCVITCADTARSWASWRDDAAAATMNMSLCAEALGLNSCWLGVYPRVERVNRMKEQFSLPDPIIPYSILALGHADSPKPPLGRFDPSCVHYNRWQRNS